MTTEMSLATRNLLALRGLGTIAPRTLQMAQDHHPDHRVFSSQGMPFPCPANGVMKAYTDIDFRRTKPKDIPEGMVAAKKRNYPKDRAKRQLGKSKWDFQYMASGSSIAIRINYPKNHELYWSEYLRIRATGLASLWYQKSRGYVDADFQVQTSEEEISVGKLRNGDDVLASHIVFWRIDGTPVDPEFQGN